MDEPSEVAFRRKQSDWSIQKSTSPFRIADKRSRACEAELLLLSFLATGISIVAQLTRLKAGQLHFPISCN
jgi:hypothetical protein